LGVDSQKAELLAISWAMEAAARTAKSLHQEEWAARNHRTKPWLRVYVISDSRNALQAIGRYIDYNDTDTCGFSLATFYDLMSPLNELHKRKVCVELRWGPAHVGLYGNERADLAAGDIRRLIQVLQPTRRPWLEYEVFPKQEIQAGINEVIKNRKRRRSSGDEIGEESPPKKRTRTRTRARKKATQQGDGGEDEVVIPTSGYVSNREADTALLQVVPASGPRSPTCVRSANYGTSTASPKQRRKLVNTLPPSLPYCARPPPHLCHTQTLHNSAEMATATGHASTSTATYGDCVTALRTSLSFLESSVNTLGDGVSDFPRLTHVLKTARVRNALHHHLTSTEFTN
jgi:ribonuclease HI